MFSKIEGVRIVSAFRRASDVSAYFAKRPNHGLQLMLNGSCHYRFRTGEEFALRENHLLFIPKGSSYEVTLPDGDETCSYAFINFTGQIQGAQPDRFECRSTDEVRLLFERILKCQLSQTLFDHYQQLALFYQIMAVLALSESEDAAAARARQTVRPALQYIKENLFDPRLRVDGLNQLCFISNTQFRKLFQLAEGTTPRRYVTDLRLGQAKKLLEEGKYAYLYEIASSVGYEDPLYFSRLFKEKYGYAPSLENVMRARLK